MLITGTDYFQLDVGNEWILHNEAYPERITTISIGRARRGSVIMRFEKNHPDTYHGFIDTNLLWWVMTGRQWIYPKNGTPGNPDDIRIDRATGKEHLRLWLSTKDSDAPACFLCPTGEFAVPSERRGTFSYFARYPNGYEGTADNGLWWVRWDLLKEDVLRIRFDESYSDRAEAIYEDWILRRRHGLICIQQWNDAERTSLLRRITEAARPEPIFIL
jgi:hypothetical protein